MKEQLEGRILFLVQYVSLGILCLGVAYMQCSVVINFKPYGTQKSLKHIVNNFVLIVHIYVLY